MFYRKSSPFRTFGKTNLPIGIKKWIIGILCRVNFCWVGGDVRRKIKKNAGLNRTACILHTSIVRFVNRKRKGMVFLCKI